MYGRAGRFVRLEYNKPPPTGYNAAMARSLSDFLETLAGERQLVRIGAEVDPGKSWPKSSAAPPKPVVRPCYSTGYGEANCPGSPICWPRRTAPAGHWGSASWTSWRCGTESLCATARPRVGSTACDRRPTIRPNGCGRKLSVTVRCSRSCDWGATSTWPRWPWSALGPTKLAHRSPGLCSSRPIRPAFAA